MKKPMFKIKDDVIVNLPEFETDHGVVMAMENDNYTYWYTVKHDSGLLVDWPEDNLKRGN